MANDLQNTAQRIHKNAAAPPERVGSHFFETSYELSPPGHPGQNGFFNLRVWRVETRITRMANDQQNTAQRVNENAGVPPARVDSYFFAT